MLYIVPKIWISLTASKDLVESLLRLISEGKTLKLKKLSGTLAQVSPELLAGAAMKLEGLPFVLSFLQMKAILTRINGTPDPKLRELSCIVSPEIMSVALVKLETVDGLKLSPDQVLSVLSRIRESPDLRLTGLDLARTNVSLVPPEVFAGALSRLETVTFGSLTRVTAPQLKSLCRTLISHQAEAGEPKLKQLKVWDSDLSSVSPEVLVGTIQRLERVEFWYVRLTEDQITVILLMLKRKQQGRLKHLQIHHPKLNPGSVSQTLLQEAKMNNAVRIMVSI